MQHNVKDKDDDDDDDEASGLRRRATSPMHLVFRDQILPPQCIWSSGTLNAFGLQRPDSPPPKAFGLQGPETNLVFRDQKQLPHDIVLKTRYQVFTDHVSL